MGASAILFKARAPAVSEVSARTKAREVNCLVSIQWERACALSAPSALALLSTALMSPAQPGTRNDGCESVHCKGNGP